MSLQASVDHHKVAALKAAVGVFILEKVTGVTLVIDVTALVKQAVEWLCVDV